VMSNSHLPVQLPALSAMPSSEVQRKMICMGHQILSMCVLQVNYLKVYQSLTNFYLNIASLSKNINIVTHTQEY
jgi:hypothetical protein